MPSAEHLIAASAIALTAVKLAGAAYLIYLGVHAFRTRKSLAAALLAPGPWSRAPHGSGSPARPAGWSWSAARAA
ncbi:MAG TPA: hypothetical protein VFG33_04870 [Kribbella sp.]|uniref:hypothetical protein n=1 Tax=Kribbella sp. TaxID=1871183 RepID=UPI002D7757F2|nr:hypothetical protein [Kribbella sp.]HET6292678.1 hypothetical protein [Kribbella sp.]